MYQPDEHRRASRPTARLLRSCSIARANVRCTISSPSTRRSCIPSHMHDTSSRRAFSKCPYPLDITRTLIALDRLLLSPTTHITRCMHFQEIFTYFLFYFPPLPSLALKVLESERTEQKRFATIIYMLAAWLSNKIISR